MNTYITTCDSPMGPVSMASDGTSLLGLWMAGQKYFQSTLEEENAIKRDELPIFDQTKDWLKRYFAGENPAIEELSLNPQGSEFRQQVWEILCRIPYGKTTSYGAIAKEIGQKEGRKMSAQAVGGAVGHNPISIIIPCHRVIGTDGSLTGYAGGLDLKVKLLQLESEGGLICHNSHEITQ